MSNSRISGALNVRIKRTAREPRGQAPAMWDERPRNRESAVRLVSLFTAAPGLRAESLIGQTRDRERFFWSEPGDRFVLAGIGIAAELVVPPILGGDIDSQPPGHRFQAIEAEAGRLFNDAVLLPAEDATIGLGAHAKLARPRLFGGFSFQDDFVPDNTWSVYNPAHFVLPHYQLAQADNETYLTINAMAGPEDDVAEVMSALRQALAARLAALLTLPAPLRTCGEVVLHYPLSAGTWRDMVEQATGAIREGKLEKVVLARVCELQTHGAIDAAAALAYLNAQYSDCYRFLFEPQIGHAFFGATPELLVEKQGTDIETMALAGSIARGATPEQDSRLAAELLGSPKDRHEHELVVAAIRDSLAPLVNELNITETPRVLPLRNIQHLLTPITARLNNPRLSILPLVQTLHPTPAMGGVPAGRAMALLRHLEPVPRGWYAAPIGWLDRYGDGSFAVAIRSAVAQHNRAWLYAGAGIVGNSQPDREWAETALKFRPMLGALGLGETI